MRFACRYYSMITYYLLTHNISSVSLVRSFVRSFVRSCGATRRKGNPTRGVFERNERSRQRRRRSTGKCGPLNLAKSPVLLRPRLTFTFRFLRYLRKKNDDPLPLHSFQRRVHLRQRAHLRGREPPVARGEDIVHRRRVRRGRSVTSAGSCNPAWASTSTSWISETTTPSSR